MPRPAGVLALILPPVVPVILARGMLAGGIAALQRRLAGWLPILAGALLALVLPAIAAAATVTLTRQPYLQSLGQGSVQILCRTSARAALRVEYGEGFRYDHAFTEASSVIPHEMTLSGLAPGRLYFYRV